MRKLALAFSIIASLDAGSVAAVEQMVIEMNCKVTGNRVTESSEGQPVYYNSIEEEFDVGDMLHLSYLLDTEFGKLVVELQDKERDDIFLFGFVKPDEDEVQFKNGGVRAYDSYGQDFSTYSDHMDFDSMGSSTLVLHRYYKSDWHGVFSRVGANDPPWGQVATLDCRTVVNEIDGLVQSLSKTTLTE